MKKEEILNYLSEIARKRNVDVLYVNEALKESLILGLKKRYGQDSEPEVEIDLERGEIKIFLNKTVAESVMKFGKEISLEEAKAIKPDAKIGDKIKVPLPLNEVGRSTIQKATDELVNRLRSVEKNKLYEEFKKKEKEITSGTIYQITKDRIIVNLGAVEGYLLPQDYLKSDRLRQGAVIKAYVIKVEKTPLGPRVHLSRTHQEFVKKLLTKEVPEIQQNIIQIKAIARIPGVRTKIAVHSEDEKIDPVGACVGFKRSRIENVLKELGEEKIDIIQWSKDLKIFIARALSPAKTKEVIKEDDKYIVIVPDSDYPIAVGKKGNNVNLASRLTGANIEILKLSDYLDRQVKEKAKTISLKELDLSNILLEKLAENQIINAFDLLTAPDENISKFINYDIEQVKKLKKDVEEKIKEKFFVQETEEENEN
ncbi:MAG: transcription termination factor NusA [Candidatus Micrarchaeia archaeon]